MRLDVNSSATRDGMCWFCQKRDAAQTAASRVTMYGNVVKDAGGNFRWDRFIVDVPRCETCLAVHGLAERLPALGKSSGVALGVLICLCLFLLLLRVGQIFISLTLALIIVFACASAGGWIGRMVGDLLQRLKGTKRNSQADEHPKVEMMFSRNFGVGEKPPYV